MEEIKYIEEAQYEDVNPKYFDVLPIKNTVLFPGVLLPIAVSKKSSLKLIKAANKEDKPLILLTQKNNNVNVRLGQPFNVVTPLQTAYLLSPSIELASNQTQVDKPTVFNSGAVLWLSDRKANFSIAQVPKKTLQPLSPLTSNVANKYAVGGLSCATDA